MDWTAQEAHSDFFNPAYPTGSDVVFQPEDILSLPHHHTSPSIDLLYCGCRAGDCFHSLYTHPLTVPPIQRAGSPEVIGWTDPRDMNPSQSSCSFTTWDVVPKDVSTQYGMQDELMQPLPSSIVVHTINDTSVAPISHQVFYGNQFFSAADAAMLDTSTLRAMIAESEQSYLSPLSVYQRSRPSGHVPQSQQEVYSPNSPTRADMFHLPALTSSSHNDAPPLARDRTCIPQPPGSSQSSYQGILQFTAGAAHWEPVQPKAISSTTGSTSEFLFYETTGGFTAQPP
ncbi:hypothetical protein OBBRIDRAFT_167082 [Obba rivulosa]|uniref:Uncharacterized protein n=1 Tax=Obba rivulosa TaxID=1052685 RepID=A0A8E2DIY5_9APHY|nr:hypothetical protein OBBRIDRAFT_167082 [Obba rivulosa]